ncbi:uncharacterized protein LOC112566557 [Pomacea canaliculata]|uniref:uncharacterized protein LOC112566557 n=1 Tax=Pomacea canaliculata TaxID=400727 RepID=UPI000D731940|nr:uncharacterized protein LOC112566557 [Pomacea canaliculata]
MAKLPVHDKVFAIRRLLRLGEMEEEEEEEPAFVLCAGKVSIHESYLHPVTEAQAALLAGSGSGCPFQDITQWTGADVEFDLRQPNVHGTKFVIIRGSRREIGGAVRLINQMTGVQESLLAQAQVFWLQWVEDAFPELDSRSYFLPPVCINRVPMTRQVVVGLNVQIVHSPPGQAGQPSPVQGYMSSPGQAGQSTPGQSGQYQAPAMGVSQPSIPQPPTVQDSDVRDDTAMQRVLLCLQKMSEENKEVLFGMSQLQFGQYLGEHCYAAAAVQLPLSSNLPPAVPRNWKQGDFDVLLIHRHYGLVVCEVKSFGQNVSKLSMSQQDIDNNIRKKLKVAVSQLNKAKAMLSHLVSDIAPGLRITKTIGVPNLTAGQIQQVISSDPQLTGDLCRCLETTDPANIPGLCLCSDQLSDPKTPWDVSSHVLTELRNWWQRRVAGAGPDSHMTCDVYKKLVARFCGPATTVTVPCTSLPRVTVKTLDQAVSLTGEYNVAQITLFPEQVHLLAIAPATVFIAGPPGTGKSVVLFLKGAEWLRCGEYVYIVSIGYGSRAACCMLYHMLLQHVNTQQAAGAPPGQPHLLQYDFADDKDVEKAVNDLSQARKRKGRCMSSLTKRVTI